MLWVPSPFTIFGGDPHDMFGVILTQRLRNLTWLGWFLELTQLELGLIVEVILVVNSQYQPYQLWLLWLI